MSLELTSPRTWETEVAGKTYTRATVAVNTNANASANVVIPAGATVVWISASASASSGNAAANGCHIGVGNLCGAGVRNSAQDSGNNSASFGSNCAWFNPANWTITITATIDAAGNHRMCGMATVVYYV